MTISYGLKRSLRPTTKPEQEFYVVPTGKKLIGRLVVCCQVSVTVKFSIALLTASGTATVNDWIRFNTPLYTGDHKTIQLDLTAGEAINVAVDTVDAISFVLSGELSDI